MSGRGIGKTSGRHRRPFHRKVKDRYHERKLREGRKNSVQMKNAVISGLYQAGISYWTEDGKPYIYVTNGPIIVFKAAYLRRLPVGHKILLVNPDDIKPTLERVIGLVRPACPAESTTTPCNNGATTA